jgi:hypothetical protein
MSRSEALRAAQEAVDVLQGIQGLPMTGQTYRDGLAAAEVALAKAQQALRSSADLGDEHAGSTRLTR